MRVLFIYPSDNLTFNAGIAYLSAELKNAGHETQLFLTDWFDAEGFHDAVEQFDPDLFAVSAVTNQFPLAEKFISLAKRLTGKTVIIGGVHATLMPEEVIRTESVDALCIGEGEEALLEFVQKMEAGESLHAIRNIWYKGPKQIFRNPMRPLATDLDALPLPDYSLFNYDAILKQMGVFMFFANRGCPYACSYCVNHSLYRLYHHENFVRLMSVPRLLEVLQQSLAKYPQANIVEFFDDTFILKRDWVREFCHHYPRIIGKPFYCNVRANLVDEELVQLLKQAGCIRVNMAIETGSEKLRRTVLKKNITNQELIRSFGLFKKQGIKTYAHNMVGIPCETEQNIKETIELNKKLEVDDLQCWVFYPYPGSDAYAFCQRKGWLTKRHFDTVAGKIVTSVLDQPSISHERVSYYNRTFKYLVLGQGTPPAEIPLEYMFLGHEESQMISGWNNLESDDGHSFRWTEERGSFYLRNTAKKSLALFANFPAPQPPPFVEISVNGLAIAHFIPQKGTWLWYEIPLPTFEETLLEISIQVDKPHLPAFADPHDLRKLGLAISKVVLENKWDRLRRNYRQFS
ncbi:B12-binding domain-containing radical SAM protein [candidate division CSSED10-310 bacterium]|uniref:B12-binding domain-containing radical SAM protein n=1 Tax=candidate division CSSED10-310 bacterium TaxID=2855610 RepID=A0ABV6Z628_UNCC1